MEINDRFWDFVLVGDGCWEWQRARNNFGYGVLRAAGRNHYAHRIAWALWFKEDPGDDLVLHQCDNSPCVRPDHLFLGSHRDNTVDMVDKGRWFDPKANRPHYNVLKTHCVHGHALDVDNVYIDARGNRNCRVCRAQRVREHKARR